MTQDSHDEKRRKHMAVMGAVKPLGAEHGTYESIAKGGHVNEELAKVAGAIATVLDRILKGYYASIPTNGLAALEAALMGAYKEGWSDGAANYHHDRNETPDDGWLISDTYKSIPTDASASRTHFEQERADHG